MNQYNIAWTTEAMTDLSQCVVFVLNVSKEAALKLRDDIMNSVKQLEIFPESNPIFNTIKSFPFELRKKVVNKRYILLYSIEDTTVCIYRVLDARRKFEQLI